MSTPSKTMTHIDKFLTDMSIAIMQDPGAYVAGLVIPTKAVSKQSDKYVVYQKGAFLRDDAKLRKSGTESVGTGYTLSSDSYYCDKYALHHDLDWDALANADAPLNLKQEALVGLAEAMKIRRERLFAAACFTTGVWTEDVSGASTTLWTDYVSSDPIKLVDQAKKNVLQRSAKRINTALLGIDVFNALKEHPDFVDRIKYTSQDSIDEAMIAKRLGVDRVLVGTAVYDSSPEGRSDTAASLGFIIDPKSALLLHSPPSVGLMTPAPAVRFAWTGSPHLPRPNGVASREFDMDEIQGTRIESEICEDIKVCGPDLGVFLSNIVA